MCGRYSITANARQLAERFQTSLPTELLLQPRYNAAPTQFLPVVINQDGPELKLFRWGLIPHWAKDASIAHKLINARAETIEEKPSFRDALRKRRCLIPADGFFEWQKSVSGKRPMRITLHDDALFAFAGLWESWRDERGELVNTFSIITTGPNALMAPIHQRMPAILSPEHESLWLDQSAGPDVWTELLRPYPADAMRAYQVSPRVNTPGNDDPAILQPID